MKSKYGLCSCREIPRIDLEFQWSTVQKNISENCSLDFLIFSQHFLIKRSRFQTINTKLIFSRRVWFVGYPLCLLSCLFAPARFICENVANALRKNSRSVRRDRCWVTVTKVSVELLFRSTSVRLKNETKQNLVYEVVCSLQKFENHFICWSRSTVMKDFLTISDWSAEVKMLIVFK